MSKTGSLPGCKNLVESFILGVYGLHKDNDALKDFKAGIVKAFPIMIGYLPIAISFGIIAMQTNLHLYQALLMSVTVFAGASQFMAVNMIYLGASGAEIVFAALVLNFRHFIMSMSLMNRLKSIPVRWKAFLSFGITDETFSVASADKDIAENTSHFFVLGLFAGSYFSWVLGTLVGGLLFMAIPKGISESMSIALYSMFIALLVPAVRKQWRFGIIAAASGLFNFVLSRWLTGGWGIVFSTIIGGSLGIFLMVEEKV